ncbi:MAG: FtsX-like permease family protein, partial [Bacteroidota bacterium]
SDAFVGELMENLSVLTISAKVIALITLLGASVALLNVMLVSVTERTNEIGLRKAMGATKKNILSQFLIEAIVICQFGGALGILLGLFVGNILSTLAFNAGFVVPWSWVIVGVIACFAVGIGAGYYPARRAARVDPIESLRHI